VAVGEITVPSGVAQLPHTTARRSRERAILSRNGAINRPGWITELSASA
jgi:hypothetical protein